MRRIFVLVVIGVVLGCAVYGASPLYAAWQIHRAVRAADTPTLERRVDWASVRQSLKRSSTEASRVLEEISQAGGSEPAATAQPTLRQRITKAVVPWVADPLIDRLVTAEGVPRLYAWRETWKQRVRPRIGLSEPQTALAGTWLSDTAADRMWTVWRRVEKVSFQSPTRLLVEVRDRLVERRRWRAVLVLDGTTWKLVALEVVRV